MIAPISPALEALCVNSLRVLAMDAVEQAKSGHPGTPMGLAPLAYVLWTRHLRHNPADPHWVGRDRFVLSCGHASMLLYGLLHLSGYDVSLDDVRQFRQWQSRTPGHPEYCHTPGVETTTGSLGQGLGNAVGMAIAATHRAALFQGAEHELWDQRIYCVASDGDLMEGISHEAASLAGHLGLGRLIGFFDDNRITIDGPTSLTSVSLAVQSHRFHREISLALRRCRRGESNPHGFPTMLEKRIFPMGTLMERVKGPGWGGRSSAVRRRPAASAP